eukprot:8634288-Pyramimonas_sp.AAC.1
MVLRKRGRRPRDCPNRGDLVLLIICSTASLSGFNISESRLFRDDVEVHSIALSRWEALSCDQIDRMQPQQHVDELMADLSRRCTSHIYGVIGYKFISIQRLVNRIVVPPSISNIWEHIRQHDTYANTDRLLIQTCDEVADEFARIRGVETALLVKRTVFTSPEYAGRI